NGTDGDIRLPVWIDWGAHRGVTGWRRERGPHQPRGQPGIHVDGEVQAPRLLRVRHSSADGCGVGERAAASLGADGPEYRFRGQSPGAGLFHLDGPAG